MQRRHLLSALKACVGLALIAYLLSRLDVQELARLAGQGDGGDLVLGVGLFLLAMLGFQAGRLHVLVAPLTGGLWVSMKLFFIGAFFNNLLPSNVGGDAVRLVYLRRMANDSWGEPFVLLMLHRLSGLMVMLVAGLVYVAFSLERLTALIATRQLRLDVNEAGLLLGAVVIVTAFAAAMALWRSRGLRARVASFLQECKGGLARIGRAQAAWLLLLTCMFHLSRLFGFLFVLRFLGHEMAAPDLVLVLAVAAVAALLPVSIAGLGVMEGAVVIMLGLYGVPASIGTAVALVNRAVLLTMGALGGLVYSMEGRGPSQDMPEPSS